MQTPGQRRTAQAIRNRRISAAERRFVKWAAEMRRWGVTVIIPDHLEPPE